MDLILQYLSFILVFELRALLSHRNLLQMCSVPKVEHPNYPGCERLRTVSKDEMISAFCKRPFNWSDRQFTLCKAFAKVLDS